MIERGWDKNRKSRITAIGCCIILRHCYDLLTNIEYDIYLIHKSVISSHQEMLMSYIKNRLIENGLKVACKDDIALDNLGGQDTMKLRYELIKKSKIILLCLDKVIEADWNCILELGNNRGFKPPRPVIPLLLEPRNENFPNNEMRAYCLMGRTDTRVFDISSFIENISSKKDIVNQNNDNDETVFLTSTSLGVDPLDLELDNLIEYINYLIQNFCVSTVS